MRLKSALILSLAGLALSACGIKRVSRVDPESVTDLSGRWNDTDSRIVANELIGQSLGATGPQPMPAPRRR